MDGSLIARFSKKCFNATSPSRLGITVYKEVTSIVKTNLLWPEKLNWSWIERAWLISLMYVRRVLTNSTICLSKWLEMSSVGQLQAETIGPPGLLGFENFRSEVKSGSFRSFHKKITGCFRQFVFQNKFANYWFLFCRLLWLQHLVRVLRLAILL